MRELENPMVIGEYFPPEPKVVDIAVCPVCGHTWEAFEIDGHIEWESKQTSGASSEPTHNGCWDCAMRETSGTMIANYIEERKLQQEAIEWCISSRSDWRGWISQEYVPLVWQAMKPLLLHEDLLRDYLEDTQRDEYIEWALDQ